MSTHYNDYKEQLIFECDFCGKTDNSYEAKLTGWRRMTTFNNVRDFCPDCWNEVGQSCRKQAEIGQYVVSGLIQ